MRVAGVDDDAIAQGELLAFREVELSSLEPVHRRGGEEAVVASEPLAGIPAIAWMLEDRDPLRHAVARARVVAPGGSDVEGSFLGCVAFGVDERATGVDRQFRHDPRGEQRVIRVENANVGQGLDGDLEIDESQVLAGRGDRDATTVADDGLLAWLPPQAFVCEDYLVA